MALGVLGYTVPARIEANVRWSRMPSKQVRQAVPAEFVADPPQEQQESPYVPSLVEDPRYPTSDGQPMSESTQQAETIQATATCLRAFFRKRKDVFVASDLLIYYREAVPPLRVAPDVFVAFGVPRGHRRTYRLWEERRPPDFVLEVASPKTVKDDVERKPGLYARIGVREYWQFDPHGDLLDPLLQGRRLVGRRYVELRPERQAGEESWYVSEVLGLHLVSEGTCLRFWDPVRQDFLRTIEESEEDREGAERRWFEAEQARQEEAHQRKSAEERFQSEAIQRKSAEERFQSETIQRQAAEEDARAAHAEIAKLKALLKAEKDPNSQP